MMIRKLFLPVSFGVAIILAGCSKKDETPPVPAVPTVTIENLKVAHANALKRSIWYAGAAKAAERERLGNLSALFRAISKSEAIHAALHEQLLVSRNQSTDTSKAGSLALGTALQALKMASSLERTEFEALYPPMIAAAGREGWPEAVEQFRHTSTADSGHLALFKVADKQTGSVPKRLYRVCKGCGTVVYDLEITCAVCKGTAFDQ